MPPPTVTYTLLNGAQSIAELQSSNASGGLSAGEDPEARTYPGARSGHSMHYSKHLNGVVLFGGMHYEGSFKDVWVIRVKRRSARDIAAAGGEEDGGDGNNNCICPRTITTSTCDVDGSSTQITVVERTFKDDDDGVRVQRLSPSTNSNTDDDNDDHDEDDEAAASSAYEASLKERVAAIRKAAELALEKDNSAEDNSETNNRTKPTIDDATSTDEAATNVVRRRRELRDAEHQQQQGQQQQQDRHAPRIGVTVGTCHYNLPSHDPSVRQQEWAIEYEEWKDVTYSNVMSRGVVGGSGSATTDADAIGSVINGTERDAAADVAQGIAAGSDAEWSDIPPDEDAPEEEDEELGEDEDDDEEAEERRRLARARTAARNAPPAKQLARREPMFGHAACLFDDDSKLFIHGGIANDGTPLGVPSYLDLRTRMWHLCDLKVGPVPGDEGFGAKSQTRTFAGNSSHHNGKASDTCKPTDTSEGRKEEEERLRQQLRTLVGADDEIDFPSTASAHETLARYYAGGGSTSKEAAGIGGAHEPIPPKPWHVPYAGRWGHSISLVKVPRAVAIHNGWEVAAASAPADNNKHSNNNNTCHTNNVPLTHEGELLEFLISFAGDIIPTSPVGNSPRHGDHYGTSHTYVINPRTWETFLLPVRLTAHAVRAGDTEDTPEARQGKPYTPTAADEDAANNKERPIRLLRYPAPRRRHAAAVHSDRFLFIFGGRSCPDDHFHADTWVFDAYTMQWYALTADVSPRQFQRAIFANDAAIASRTGSGIRPYLRDFAADVDARLKAQCGFPTAVAENIRCAPASAFMSVAKFGTDAPAGRTGCAGMVIDDWFYVMGGFSSRPVGGGDRSMARYSTRYVTESYNDLRALGFGGLTANGIVGGLLPFQPVKGPSSLRCESYVDLATVPPQATMITMCEIGKPPMMGSVCGAASAGPTSSMNLGIPTPTFCGCAGVDFGGGGSNKDANLSLYENNTHTRYALIYGGRIGDTPVGTCYLVELNHTQVVKVAVETTRVTSTRASSPNNTTSPPSSGFVGGDTTTTTITNVTVDERRVAVPYAPLPQLLSCTTSSAASAAGASSAGALRTDDAVAPIDSTAAATTSLSQLAVGWFLSHIPLRDANARNAMLDLVAEGIVRGTGAAAERNNSTSTRGVGEGSNDDKHISTADHTDGGYSRRETTAARRILDVIDYYRLPNPPPPPEGMAQRRPMNAAPAAADPNRMPDTPRPTRTDTPPPPQARANQQSAANPPPPPRFGPSGAPPTTADNVSYELLRGIGVDEAVAAAWAQGGIIPTPTSPPPPPGVLPHPLASSPIPDLGIDITAATAALAAALRALPARRGGATAPDTSDEAVDERRMAEAIEALMRPENQRRNQEWQQHQEEQRRAAATNARTANNAGASSSTTTDSDEEDDELYADEEDYIYDPHRGRGDDDYDDSDDGGSYDFDDDHMQYFNGYYSD